MRWGRRRRSPPDRRWGGGLCAGLKGNQETLHQAVIDYIDEQLEGDLADAQEHVTTEKGHGREETRTYLQLPAPEELPGFMLWKGLKSIGIVTSCCLRDGKETIEVRYYISSLAVGVKRSPGGPGPLGYREYLSLEPGYDVSRGRVATPRAALAGELRVAEPVRVVAAEAASRPPSLVMKRRSCGWSDDFLMEVVTGPTFSVLALGGCAVKGACRRHSPILRRVAVLPFGAGMVCRSDPVAWGRSRRGTHQDPDRRSRRARPAAGSAPALERQLLDAIDPDRRLVGLAKPTR